MSKKLFFRKFSFIFSIFCLVLALGAVGLVPTDRPLKAADPDCTFTTSGKIDQGQDTCNGRDVVISGASTIFVINGEHTFNNLAIIGGATLTHDAGLTVDGSSTGKGIGMKLTVNELVIDESSQVDVSGKGYPERTGYNQLTPLNNCGEHCQNGVNGASVYIPNPTSASIVQALENGGTGGGSGGYYPFAGGPGAGGGFVGGGGAGIGKRTGGGGAGAGLIGGLGHSGACMTWSQGCEGQPIAQPVQGGTPDQSDLQDFFNQFFLQSDELIMFGYGGGGGDGLAGLRVVWPNVYFHYALGGKGGGAVAIQGNSFQINGTIKSNGDAAPTTQLSSEACGASWNGYTDKNYGGGGGGAGGSIALKANTINIGSNGMVEAKGGNGPNSCRSKDSQDDYRVSGGGGGGGGLIVILSLNPGSISDLKLPVFGGTTDPDVEYNNNGVNLGKGGNGFVYKKVAGESEIVTQPHKVTVIVTWDELGEKQKVELSTWLRDLK